MKMKVFCFIILTLLPWTMECGPMHSGKSGDNALLRFIRDASSIRNKRQSEVVCEEGNITSCLPEGFDNVPPELVNCIAGECVCNECFMMNGSTGLCSVCSDYMYSPSLGQCSNDRRPSQLTAFLLSLFVSSTGAANFYIGRNDLAGGQLFLLILVFVVSYSMCCFPCCLACCMGKDDVKGSIVFILLMFVFVLLTVLASIAMWAWWLADLIIFATNQRLSGNGCMLTPNL